MKSCNRTHYDHNIRIRCVDYVYESHPIIPFPRNSNALCKWHVNGMAWCGEVIVLYKLGPFSHSPKLPEFLISTY